VLKNSEWRKQTSRREIYANTELDARNLAYQTPPTLGYRFVGLADVIERPVSLIRELPSFQITAGHRALHHLSRSEIGGGKRIKPFHLFACGPNCTRHWMRPKLRTKSPTP